MAQAGLVEKLGAELKYPGSMPGGLPGQLDDFLLCVPNCVLSWSSHLGKWYKHSPRSHTGHFSFQTLFVHLPHLIPLTRKRRYNAK